MADRPSNAGREDTVVRPLSGEVPPAPSNGTAARGATRPTNGASRTAAASGATTRTAAAGAAPAAAPATGTATAATPAEPRRAAAPKASAPKGGRRARLRLTRVDPWSVMKTSFLLSIALAVVTVVAVFMVWTVLGAADVWSSINSTVQDVVGGQDTSDFDIQDYLGTSRVVGFTMIVAAVDVVLLTAIATLGAFLYNMSASLLGGVEVTLAEDN